MAGQRQSITVDVSTDAFSHSLAAAFRSLKIKSEADLHRVAIETSNAAKKYCPVATGRLRAAIGYDPQLGHDEQGAYVDVGVTVERLGSPTNYGTYVEFGTSKMMAQPFMRPGLAEAGGLWNSNGLPTTGTTE